MGRALPAVAQLRKLGGLSDILLTHHDDAGDAEHYGVYFRRSRVAWWDRPGGRRRLAYLRGQRCHSFTGDALAWNLETDGFEALPIYREPSWFRVTAIAPAMTNCRFG